MEELIKCTNLYSGYQGKEIIKNLSFSVNRGDYLCIVGANGAGKSTLMKTILGLNKPMKGTIEYCNGLSQNDLGYLPQQTVVQKDFPSSVFEVVLSGCLNKLGYKPFYTKKEKEIAIKAMDSLGITHLKKKSYKELSGGQQQRVLLARALAASDQLLLLDEPVTGLDPEITKELYSIIYNLNKEHQLTIIMITHDIKDAVSYANKVLKLDQDYFFGTKEEYIELSKEEL